MGTLAALFAVGAVTSAAGSYQQGVAAQQAADYNAAIIRNNAQMAEYSAQDVARRADFTKGQKRRETQQNVGRARVAYAANGVQLGSGSAAQAEADLVSMGEEDLAMIEYNSQLEQWGFRAKGVDLQNQANLSAAQGRQAHRAGNVGAFTSLIGAATQYYGMKLG